MSLAIGLSRTAGRDPVEAEWALPMSSPPPTTTPRYANYALGLLLGVYIFNFIDRQILSILMEKIKEEIHLSDTELGFLGGIAFALFYTIAGLPIARWADRRDEDSCAGSREYCAHTAATRSSSRVATFAISDSFRALLAPLSWSFSICCR